jgi:hypothetical protein
MFIHNWEKYARFVNSIFVIELTDLLTYKYVDYA